MVQQLRHRLSQLSSRAKRSYFHFRLRPARRFSHFLDRGIFTVNHQQRLLVLRRQHGEQSIGQIRCDHAVLNRVSFATLIYRVLVQPALLVFGEIRNRRLRSPFRASHHIKTRVGRNPCQPSFQRSTTFKTSKLRERFQKNFLRRFFNHTSLPEKPARDTKHSRAVASHYLRERGLVASLRLSREVQVYGLFEPNRQLRSSSV